MTLFKQIVIILSFFQTIILASVMWQNFKQISDSVQTQLEVGARHTANSLGLSMTPAAATNDLITIETMMSSTFDSGYYESIVLKNPEGKVLVQNKQPVVVADVPDWFIGLFSLQAPEAKSEIMAGWSQFGTLHVKNNIGMAYRQLWFTFKDISSTFTIITLIAFLILYFSLKAILKPLALVQEQAEAITGNDFILQENLPRTRELKHVVGAMNSMVSKVKEIFDKESETVKKYHILLYQDALSGLYNRRYFILKVKEILASSGGAFGSIVFGRLTNGEKIKSELGYKKTEELMKEISSCFNEINHEQKDIVNSKMEAEDYAFLLPNTQSADISYMYVEVSKKLDKLLESYGLDNDKYYFNFGMVDYDENSEMSDIFSKADFALTTAKSKGKFGVQIHVSNDEDDILGKEAWKEEILDSLKNNRFVFAMQKVIDEDEQIYHSEIFLRLKDKKEHIKSAAYFMPVVNELKLNDAVDKYVIEKAINLLKEENRLQYPCGINIGKEILLDSETYTWFKKQLKSLQNDQKDRLSFEISSRSKVSTDILSSFSKLLRGYGIGFGLDNFTLDGDGLKVLQDLNPAYIKISAVSILDLLDNKEGESSKQSLSVITQSMDIKVIAFGVKNQEEKDKLLQMGIKYVQGNFIEEPYIFN